MADERLPELENPCPQCDGGRIFQQWGCGLCHGTGYELTEAGEQIYELLRHQFKRLVDERVK